MKTKTQKDIKKEVIKENIFKALHIVGYASIGILALLGIVMGVQSCKSKNSHNNDSQQQLKQPQMAVRDNNTIPSFEYNYGYGLGDVYDAFCDEIASQNNGVVNNYYGWNVSCTGTWYANTYSSSFSYVHVYVASGNKTAGQIDIFHNNSATSVSTTTRPFYKLSITKPSNGTGVFFTGFTYASGSTNYTTNSPIFVYSQQLSNSYLSIIYDIYLAYQPVDTSEIYGTGYSEGYETGYSEGYETGYSEGVENATPSEQPQNETIYLNGYDYRGWFGNVDSDTGLIQYEVSQATYLTYGGVEWKNKGNGRIYNFVSMIIQPVEQNVVFAIGKEMEYDANTTFYNGRTGQQLYGSDYNKFSFVSRIYYGYKENYNGGEMESGTWEYRDTIYEMPLVSCRNTEAIFVSGWLSHDYNIAPLYRSMEIIQNSGTKFNTPKYNDVSIVELWKMDLNNYIGVSNPATETNVFTMLSKAFSSITSVLSIEILPHMTLGLFLFVPLVVGIVFAVIKVIKK